jgi:hypothetical protein
MVGQEYLPTLQAPALRTRGTNDRREDGVDEQYLSLFVGLVLYQLYPLQSVNGQ